MVTSAARPPLHFQNSILPPLARMSGWNTVYIYITTIDVMWEAMKPIYTYLRNTHIRDSCQIFMLGGEGEGGGDFVQLQEDIH